MRADASGQFSLLVISHHLRATEVCAAAEQPLDATDVCAAAEQPLADLAQCFGWLVACDFTHHTCQFGRRLGAVASSGLKLQRRRRCHCTFWGTFWASFGRPETEIMLFYQGILITDTARRPIGRIDRITHDTSLNLMELLPSLSIRKVRCNFL